MMMVCPRCHGALDQRADSFQCTACGSVYPIVAGITDFRTTADPWISIEDDRAKALRLESDTKHMSFEESVRAYWKMTPGTPDYLAERFTSHVMRAEQRSREWLAHVNAAGDSTSGSRPWLDLGCGTADLAAAAPRDVVVVGLDIALRWLVVARRRGPEAAAPLVCADAAHLPFANGSFQRIVSLGMLEHCIDQQAVLNEAARVLVDGGRVDLRTTNRFTLAKEPHVGVWGVGWLPRAWADGFVHMRSGQRYLHHRPLSSRELGRGLRRAGFQNVRVESAAIMPSELPVISARTARAVRAYHSLRRHRGAGGVLTRIAPLLEARADK